MQILLGILGGLCVIIMLVYSLTALYVYFDNFDKNEGQSIKERDKDNTIL